MKSRLQALTILLLVGATALAACGPAGLGSGEKTLYVGPYLVDCVGVAPQKSMLVKEKQEEDWTLFYDQIAGFDYEPGYEYALTVKEEKVENPPADASSLRVTLVEVVDKTRSLAGTPWLLESYLDQNGQMVDVLSGTQISAIFQDGQTGGSAGCNSYFGTYEVDGSKIDIEVGGMTMMYCPPEETMAQETDYVTGLNSTIMYIVEGEQLPLADEAGNTLLKYGVLEPTSLVGTTWEMMRYNDGRGGLSSAIRGTEITAFFAEDGSLTGSSGCNQYAATWEVPGNVNASSGPISIGPAATTRMFCGEPEGTMEQEGAYLAALEAVTAYEIKGNELELTNHEGTEMAAYVAGEGSAGLDQEALGNMTYKSEWTQAGTATLENGEYREQAAPGSATETVVRLGDQAVNGELNGEPVAVVVLITDPGGSGTFYELAVVTEQAGEPVHVASAPLGDRVQLNSVEIDNNQIIVDMVNQGPDDPMCCPTQQVVQTYALQGEELVQTSSETAGSGFAGEQSLVGPVWHWLQFVDPLSKTMVDDPSQYTVEFKPDGEVQVKADCNSGNGTYTTEGSSISIEVLAMTRAMCPPESLSDQFVQYLNEAAIYFFEGEELFLDLPADSGTMRFAPAQ